jgi:heterodisulfide reductase subunit A
VGGKDQKIGVFVCDCGVNIAATVDTKQLAEYAKDLPGVVFSIVNKYTCAEPGQEEIKKAIVDNKLDRVVVAACTPRMHEPTFRQCVQEVDVNPYLMEMANIREHCSWVHSTDKKKATEKAKDIIKAAVARVRKLNPQEEIEVPVAQSALVIGGGVAGMQAALDLADTGYPVYLVEKGPTIGGLMAQLDKVYPSMD